MSPSRSRPMALLPLVLALATPLAASPALVPRWVVNDWVTVGANAEPTTIRPIITTVNGAASTISPAPYLLTGTVFTITSGTRVATSTGTLQPVPTATANNGAGGIFAVCNNQNGANSPFCQPKADADLSVGKTYYITWDASHFANPSNTLVKLSAFYTPSTIPVFDSVRIVASRGFYPFTVDDFYRQGRESKDMRFNLTYIDADGDERAILGPIINVVAAPITVSFQAEPQPSGGSSTGKTVGIAVGVVVGLLVLGALLWFLWRRNRDKLVLGAIRRRSSQGYGVGQSRAQRIAATKGSYQLDDSPTSPTPAKGQNVFREEIRRQETARS